MNFLNPLIAIYLDDNIKDEQKEMPFYREVLWLFSKNLNNRLGMFKHRVNIEIQKGETVSRNFRFGSIYSYQTGLNWEGFKSLDELAKRKKILDLVYAGFISLAAEFNWNKDVLTDAYYKSIKDNYHFVYYTDFKVSRNRRFKGRIRINLIERLATFTSEIIDLRTEELQANLLLKTEEGNFAWWRLVKEFGWLEADRFGLKFLNGQIWITSNTYSNEVVETLVPKKNDTYYLNSFLNRLKEPIANVPLL